MFIDIKDNKLSELHNFNYSNLIDFIWKISQILQKQSSVSNTFTAAKLSKIHLQAI